MSHYYKIFILDSIYLLVNLSLLIKINTISFVFATKVMYLCKYNDGCGMRNKVFSALADEV